MKLVHIFFLATLIHSASAVTHTVNHQVSFWPNATDIDVSTLPVDSSGVYTWSLSPGENSGYDSNFNDGTVAIYWDMLVAPTSTLGVQAAGWDLQNTGATFSFDTAPSAITASGYTVSSSNLSITFDSVLLRSSSTSTGLGSTVDFTVDGITTTHLSSSSAWADRATVTIDDSSFSTAYNSGESYLIGGMTATITGTVELEAVPEPSSLALLGLGGLSLLCRRKR